MVYAREDAGEVGRRKQVNSGATGAGRRWNPARVAPVLDFVIVLSLLVAPLAWLMDPWRLAVGPLRLSVSWSIKPVIVPVVLLALRGVLARGFGGFLSRALIKRLLLAVYAAWAMLLVAEGALALAGFDREIPPVTIEGDAGAEESPARFAHDAELGWVFQRGGEFRGRPVNRLGFLDREVDVRKEPGTRRVICMGDSCAAQGSPPYSGYLHAQLAEDPVAPGNWEAFNVGVHGYSSWQGRKLYRLRVKEMAPDVVTLHFGWNDHWSAPQPDSVRFGRVFGARLGALLNALHRKRFYAFMVHAARGPAKPDSGETLAVRVPPETYARTLREWVDEIRADGAIPILVTAPRAARLASQVVRNNKLADMEEALAIHDRYVELTRRVANEKDVEIVDLAARFSGPDAAPLFSGDGIHFRKEGLRRIADEIHAHLRAMAERGEL